MTWIDKLDKKIGKFAPKKLILFIIGLYVAGFIIGIVNPYVYSSYLCLDIEKILQGQVWRIITWLMYPSSSILFFVLTAYMYFWIGRVLENEWGSFQFDLYYISGILIHVLVTLVLYVITGTSYVVTPEYLNLSLFMAYAALFPNRVVLFFFILPLKAKWLAFIDLFYFAIAMLKGLMQLPFFSVIVSKNMVDPIYSYYYISEAIAAFSALIVFAVYYFSGMTGLRSSIKDTKRRNEFQKQMKVVVVNKPQTQERHKCEVCGRTDLTNPDLEFRFCSKCDGVHEYCMDHLYTHEHIHEHKEN